MEAEPGAPLTAVLPGAERRVARYPFRLGGIHPYYIDIIPLRNKMPRVMEYLYTIHNSRQNGLFQY